MNPIGDDNLISLGTHCAVANCQQLDFLPFKCDCCSRVFCLEHRTYSAHNCASSGNKELSIFVCPVCAKGVRLQPGEDANSAFEKHSRAECDPSNYARVHRKPKCQAPSCKEKLTTINSYQCNKCGQRVCLKHRFPEDHNCQNVITQRKRAVSDRFSSMFSSTMNSMSNLASSLNATASATAATAPSTTSSTSTFAGARDASTSASLSSPLGAGSDSSRTGGAPPRPPVPSPFDRGQATSTAASSSSQPPSATAVRTPFGPPSGGLGRAMESSGNAVGAAYGGAGGVSGGDVRSAAAARAASAAEARAAAQGNRGLPQRGAAGPAASQMTSGSAEGRAVANKGAVDTFQCHLCNFRTADPACLITHVEVCSATRGVDGSNSARSAATVTSSSGSVSKGPRSMSGSKTASGRKSGDESNCNVM